jgi:hypothetical protein
MKTKMKVRKLKKGDKGMIVLFMSLPFGYSYKYHSTKLGTGFFLMALD